MLATSSCASETIAYISLPQATNFAAMPSSRERPAALARTSRLKINPDPALPSRRARMTTRRLALAGLFCGMAVLAGCSTTPTYGPRYVEVVRVEPPPPRIEVYGPPPVVGHLWISGYWNWGGSRYVWVPGRWEAPRHGHHWIPHRWERDGDRWRQHGGFWERSAHAEPVRPPLVHERQHHDVSRGDSHDRRDRIERRDWGHRPESRVEPRVEPREERREAPRVEHRDSGRIDRADGHDRSPRHDGGSHRDHSPPTVVSRQEAPRVMPEAPRGSVQPSESRRESRGEERGRSRNDNDERRERGRGREGN